MTDHIRSLAQLSPFRVACVPNAGLPDENGCYLETPEMVSTVLVALRRDRAGSMSSAAAAARMQGHIEALAKLAAAGKPRVPNPPKRSFSRESTISRSPTRCGP